MKVSIRLLFLALVFCAFAWTAEAQEYPFYEYSFSGGEEISGQENSERDVESESLALESIPGSEMAGSPLPSIENREAAEGPLPKSTLDEPSKGTTAIPISVAEPDVDRADGKSGTTARNATTTEDPLDRLLSACGLWFLLGLFLCVIVKAFGAPAPFKDGSDAFAGLLWTVGAPVGFVAFWFFSESRAWRIGGYVLVLLSVASLYQFLVRPIVENLTDPKRFLGILVGRIGAACIILPIVVLFLGLKFMTIPLARTNVIGDRDPKKRVYKWEADEIKRKTSAYQSVVSGLFGTLIWPLLFQKSRDIG